MPRPIRVVVAVLAVGLAACAAPDPGRRVEALRRQFSATLQGVQVHSSSPSVSPSAAPAPAKQASPRAAPGPTASAAEDGVGLLAPPAVTSDVELLLEVHNGSSARLDGLTLEISLLDGDQETQHYRLWVDTASLIPGGAQTVRYLLREVPFKASERFAVEVRDQVPAAERALYREFPRS